MTAKSIWALVRRTASEFMDDKAMRLSAAIAFYTALSIAPLLLVVISVVGFVYSEEAAQEQLHAQLQDQLGPQAAEMVQSLVANSTPERGGAWAALIGVVTLLVGATGVFSQLQDALNTIWDIDEGKSPPGGIWQMAVNKLLSFAMVCAAALLLLASLVTSAVVSGVGQYADEWFGIGAGWLRFADTAISLAVTFGMFALMFKFLPFERPRWRDVWIGAGATTVLFAIGKYLIGLYLGRAAVGSTFGAAGSFVVLLMWLYYSSIIFLFGAEFTQVYARDRAGSESQARSQGIAESQRGRSDRRADERRAAPSLAQIQPAREMKSTPEPSNGAGLRHESPSLAQILLFTAFALIFHLVGALRNSESRPDGQRRERASTRSRRGTVDEYLTEYSESDDDHGGRYAAPVSAEASHRGRTRGD